MAGGFDGGLEEDVLSCCPIRVAPATSTASRIFARMDIRLTLGCRTEFRFWPVLSPALEEVDDMGY